MEANLLIYFLVFEIRLLKLNNNKKNMKTNFENWLFITSTDYAIKAISWIHTLCDDTDRSDVSKVESDLSMKHENLKCMGIMQDNLCHPYH